MGDPAIEVLHVGSASRDLTDDDPRGWRLGGGVIYAALTTARLGLRTAAVIGVDALAATAAELDLLRLAGAEVLLVPLAESPAFRNVETPVGRIQTCVAPGRRLPPLDLPTRWAAATAWSLVPVAGEISDGSPPDIPDQALVALGWQGWLRILAAGDTVGRRAPAPFAWLRRADLVGVSRHDLAPRTDEVALTALLSARASLLVTDGAHGGRLLRLGDPSAIQRWAYDAVEPEIELDPTGAGDVFLGALVASLVRPSIIADHQADIGLGLAFAASAASLVIERLGVLGVPDLAAVRARLRRGRRGRLEPPSPRDRA